MAATHLAAMPSDYLASKIGCWWSLHESKQDDLAGQKIDVTDTFIRMLCPSMAELADIIVGMMANIQEN